MTKLNLAISPDPARNEIAVSVLAARYSAVINVADSPCLSLDMSRWIPSLWFPVNEVGDWGYAVFYGAQKTWYSFRTADKPVLIHCHGGAVRAPHVVYALLLGDGMSEEGAAKALETKDLPASFKRKMRQGYIPKDIVEFLKAAKENPTFSIIGVLNHIGSKNTFLPVKTGPLMSSRYNPITGEVEWYKSPRRPNKAKGKPHHGQKKKQNKLPSGRGKTKSADKGRARAKGTDAAVLPGA